MSWIKRKWSWAKQNPLFWCNFVFIAAIVAVIWAWPAPKASDFRVRFLGMVMQLVGILTVWHDLTAAARHFGKGGPLSFFARTGKWLKAGFFRPSAIGVAASFESVYDILGGRAKVRQPIDGDAALADRIAGLEALATQIDADLDNAFKEIEERTSELKTKISAEAAARAFDRRRKAQPGEHCDWQLRAAGVRGILAGRRCSARHACARDRPRCSGPLGRTVGQDLR